MEQNVKVLLSNEEDFNKLIEKIDNELINEGIKIQIRSIVAAKKISELTGIGVAIVGEERFLRNIFTPESLGAHIIMWYKSKYGDKLIIDFNIAHIIIIIRGEPYKISLPNFLNIKDIKMYFESQKSSFYGSNYVNIYTKIENLTSHIANSLTEIEIDNIFDWFHKYHYLFWKFKNLDYYRKMSYRDEMYSDLNNAVELLVGRNPHFGNSKWSILQFTEKLMKSYILYINNVTVEGLPTFREKNKIKTKEWGHQLKILNEKWMNNIIPNELLEKIECSAGVRYGEEKVNLNEVIEAHESVLKVFEIIMLEIEIHFVKQSNNPRLLIVKRDSSGNLRPI